VAAPDGLLSLKPLEPNESLTTKALPGNRQGFFYWVNQDGVAVEVKTPSCVIGICELAKTHRYENTTGRTPVPRGELPPC
jgi:hypothetical protein